MTAAPAPTALLVPGSFTGAWSWEMYFAPALRDRGWHVVSHTFKSHEANAWQQHTLGLDDFVAEVEDAVRQLPTKPWLIAHSLGGRVALEYLAKTKTKPQIAGLVLLSPAPPDGMWRISMHMAQSNPLDLNKFTMLSLLPAALQTVTAPAGVFSTAMPSADKRYYINHLRGESSRVLMEAQLPMWRSVRNLPVPIFVIGAEGDMVVPASSVRHTAQQLDAPYHILPGSSHTMMSDVGWQDLLEITAEWVEQQDTVTVTAEE